MTQGCVRIIFFVLVSKTQILLTLHIVKQKYFSAVSLFLHGTNVRLIKENGTQAQSSHHLQDIAKLQNMHRPSMNFCETIQSWLQCWIWVFNIEIYWYFSKLEKQMVDMKIWFLYNSYCTCKHSRKLDNKYSKFV